MRFPGKDSLLKPQPAIPHVRQPACGMRTAPTSGQSGSQTGPHQHEPNHLDAYFLYKVRFLPFFLFFLYGISVFVFAGCGSPTNGDQFAVGNPTAGLRHSDMSGLPESKDELPKQIPHKVDLTCPVQNFADNVTVHQHFADNDSVHANGLGARSFEYIRDKYRTPFSLGPMSSELDSEPLTSHYEWNPSALLRQFVWNCLAPVRPSCHSEMPSPVENSNLQIPKYSLTSESKDPNYVSQLDSKEFPKFQIQNIREITMNFNQSQIFGVEFHNCDISYPHIPGFPEYPKYPNAIPMNPRPVNLHVDAFLVIYVLAATLHGPSLQATRAETRLTVYRAHASYSHRSKTGI